MKKYLIIRLRMTNDHWSSFTCFALISGNESRRRPPTIEMIRGVKTIATMRSPMGWIVDSRRARIKTPTHMEMYAVENKYAFQFIVYFYLEVFCLYERMANCIWPRAARPMLYPAQPRAKKIGAKTRRILKSNNDSEVMYHYHLSKVTNHIYSYK